MDAKQLGEAGRQIVKANDGGDPPATILGLLKPLHEWTATEALLRSSKIGVYVNKLRQNKDAKVSEAATRVINKWKHDVKGKVAKVAGSPAPGAGSRSNGATPAAANGTSSPAPGHKAEEVVKREGRKSKVPPGKRNADVDEVNWQLTDEVARNGSLKCMYNGLCIDSTDSPDDIIVVARNIELAAYNEYKVQKDYAQKMRSLYQNLKMNADLRKDVAASVITPKEVVKMSSDDMKSKKRRESDARLEHENMKEAMTAEQIKSISTTYVSYSMTLNVQIIANQNPLQDALPTLRSTLDRLFSGPNALC
nr:transcription elongation factor s-ii [Quercus suber]